ncbi:hypothetical protein DPMN_158409 [Dreissena polymorpha]|uniref:Uncharacterized protein n=1 Tax=Dreissena polymorpha TaxID=45954 RepID=A0A9D4ILY9_DREPO|nr:hypothetical protein DPMN_158409 [Dreissena polymorpha]
MLLLFCFIKSVVEILKFTAGATHEVNISSESHIGDGSSNDGDRGVVVIKSLLHYLHKVEQDERADIPDGRLLMSYRSPHCVR